MSHRVGVDEAGKGPVLGSMFVTAVRVREAETLPGAIADSKSLSPPRREELAQQLTRNTDVETASVEIPVERIDDPRTDMNSLTVKGHADVISSISTAGDTVITDASDTDEGRFARRIRTHLNTDVAVIARHQADERYGVVQAASVLSKVARDSHVAALAGDHPGLIEEHGDLGSGYPADPTTLAFLDSYVTARGEVPSFARASWSTCERLLNASGQSELDER